MFTSAAKKFNTSRATVRRIWEKALVCFNNNDVVNVDCKKRGIQVEKRNVMKMTMKK